MNDTSKDGDFYSHFGFTSNPFENNTAEREPEIASYAVRPPYLDRVFKTSNSNGIFVLTGSRGSGKSATRLTVSKLLWDKTPKRLVIPLIGHNIFRQYPKGAPVELLANQIAFLAIEQILGWLTSLSEQDQANLLANMSGEDKAFIRKMLGNFYLNRDENARKASAEECFKTLDLSLRHKGILWADKRWDQLAGALANIASKLGEKYFEVDFGDPKSYAELLKRQQKAGFDDPLYIFSKIVEFARIFGFSGVVVHIDKVDETDWTANNVVAAAQLIYPLLANIQIHEIDGLTWTFFLWDKLKDELTEATGRPVRWDKIPEGEISWTLPFLGQLIEKRIAHFSKESRRSLWEICDDSVNPDDILAQLADISESSPRNLVTLLDIVVGEHIQRNQNHYTKLSEMSFQLGMDVYTRKSLANAGLTAMADQIAKIKLIEFATSDVASRFKIGSQPARGRIDSWEGIGLIEYSESRVGPSGGRPVDYFKVTDPRLRRVIDRNL